MKATKIIFAILLFIFAALQYNDPDPWLWIFIYAAPAVIIILDLAGKPVKRIYLITIVALALFSLVYLPGVIDYITAGEPGVIVESMKATKPYIEETREFIGLLIVISILLVFYFKGK